MYTAITLYKCLIRIVLMLFRFTGETTILPSAFKVGMMFIIYIKNTTTPLLHSIDMTYVIRICLHIHLTFALDNEISTSMEYDSCA